MDFIRMLTLLFMVLISRTDPAEVRPEFETILAAQSRTEVAPHGEGNVYAPDVLFDGEVYRMWYGGQGRDGHDRIHLAESADGKRWTRRGVVIDRGTANHVNDPSVVKVGPEYFLYYTLAGADVVDEIALATSKDGIAWEPRGVVLRPGKSGEWDALLVGRPSVLFDGRTFSMWYDGRKDLPEGAPAKGVPKSPNSTRSVGLATSKDGLHWTKSDRNPVLGGDAGGVDVERTSSGYVMVFESHEGTRAATSPDGVAWREQGLLVPRSGGASDRHGHVTPMILPEERGRGWSLFVGGVRAATWDHNVILRTRDPRSPDQQPVGPKDLRRKTRSQELRGPEEWSEHRLLVAGPSVPNPAFWRVVGLPRETSAAALFPGLRIPTERPVSEQAMNANADVNSFSPILR